MACGLLLGVAGQAQGHDFWIEPLPSKADPQRLEITLRVGSDFAGDSVPNIPPWYLDFSLVDSQGRRAVNNQMGDDPAAVITRTPEQGMLLFGYQNRPQKADLPPDKFNAYLKNEGLDDILALRKARGLTGAEASELYQRCAKALVDGAGDVWRQTLGYHLELTPLVSPFSGGPVKVRLTFDGQPLAERKVFAYRREEPARHLTAVTDAEGVASFSLEPEGFWLIKTVYMLPFDGPQADWISYWGSLTFQRE